MDVNTLVSGEHGVEDKALSASTSYSEKHGFPHARLYTKASTDSAGGWCTAKEDAKKYIQVMADGYTCILMIQLII